jgi:hypothetical protein
MLRKPQFWLALSLALVIAPGFILGASAPKYQKTSIDLQRHAGGPDEIDMSGGTPSRRFGNPVTVGPRAAAAPGITLGFTTYDYQHNGSTGRQIDKFGDDIQVSFMKGTQNSLAIGRNVHWNTVKITGSPSVTTLDNGDTLRVFPFGVPKADPASTASVYTSGTRPGYTTFRNLPTGRGVIFFHDAPDDAPGSETMAAVDNGNSVGVWGSVNIVDQPVDVIPEQEMIWPKTTVDVVGSDTILHLLACEFGLTTDQKMYYWRGTLSGGTTVINWAQPVLIDTVSVLSPVMEQDPTSDDVTIVYTKPRALGTQTNNDLVYRRSTNGGLTWNSMVNVTNYTDDSLNRAYTDIDAVYDEDGTMHVLFNTLANDPATGISVTPTDLVHWNDLRLTQRVLLTAEWENSCGPLDAESPDQGGVFNLQTAKMNLVVKPAGAGPGAGIPDELIYALWVQFGPTDTDCATGSDSVTLGGYVNADIYCSVSSNDGLTWDRPSNVTGTETPDCTPGNCHSEHWVSAAARADSGLYISFTDDSHAGGITQDEGAWSESPYVAMAIEARQPVLEPRIGVTPQTFLELNADTLGTRTIQVAVDNLGNADLTYAVQVESDNGGAAHVLVNGGGSFGNTILAGGATNLLDIQYDGLGLPNPSEHNWRLTVTSNDPANDPGQGGTAIDINLNVFVANPWFTCTSDTISTAGRRLAVSSCLELGDKGVSGGMFGFADSTQWLYDASPFVARDDAGTNRVHRDVFYEGIADRDRATNQAFRAQSAINVARNTTVDTFLADVASGVATTTDSLIQLDWEVTTFKSPELSNGAVMHYTVTNRTGTTFTDLHLGAVADVDVDSASSTNDGIASESKQYVGAQGGYEDTSDVFFPQENYQALFYIPLDSGCADDGAGAWVTDNVDYVYPDGGFDSDSLFNIVDGTLGWNAATRIQDTITDVNVVLVNQLDATLAPNDTLEFAFGVASSNVGISDLETLISKLKAAANPTCISGCLIQLSGDVNESGALTSADIIYLVNFVFKGQAAPLPCAANGDVNCSGAVTSADIIYMVNHVFKGQPAPCDICADSPAANTCT